MSKLSIKRPERVVPLCLNAALQAEWEQAEKSLAEARRRPAGDRLTGNAGAATLAEAVRDLEAQMLADVVHFRLRALPRSEWAKRLAAHPAKDDDPSDKAFGADKAGFFDDVIPASIVGVTRGDEPVDFDPATDWSDLADEMTDRQYSDFADAVFMLNRGEVSVPFSRAASSMSRASSETSK